MATKPDTTIRQKIDNVQNEFVVYYKSVSGRIAVDFGAERWGTRAHESMHGDR
jgi:hypothetical protein